MNYWHIQLHPNDPKKFSIPVIKEILKKKAVIGLGEWDKGLSAKTDLFDNMAINDVVLVKQGATPVALVRVTSDAYVEDNVEDEFDWFEYRRKVVVLDYYRDDYDFKFPQPMGTLSICSDLHKPTSQIIINWHRKVIARTIMNNIKLTSQRQEELRVLWRKFKDGYSESDCRDEIKEIEYLLSQWNEYKEKISNDTLTLEEYTNRKDSEGAYLPGGYLCNFLERTTKTKFGSSKPGNANNFEVKLNRDGETYTLRKDLKKGDKQNENSYDVANEFFNNEIKPILKNIVDCVEASDKALIVENSDYPAKQVLRKLAVLDHMHQFLFIYADDTIDALHADILMSEEQNNLHKNHEIRLAVNSILSVEDTLLDNVLLSRFLWKYANTQGLADKDTPNVILYGPPGTGKTYAVKNSLDFLCQGDRSRYEFIQFHPSFTYEDFIEGIKPKGVTSDGNIKFELVDGVFKRFCKKAKNDPDKDYYFVVDEINRANLSSVFGETLLCLEKDYRHDPAQDDNLIKTQYSSLIEDMINDGSAKTDLAYHYSDGNVYFGVPKNVFFIGMMNDVDKSIDAFDLALRRRFKWIRKDCDYDVIENEVKFRNGGDFNNIDSYQNACRDLNKFISEELGMGKSFEFGHSFFMKVTSIATSRTITGKNLENLFKLHLQPTLKEYLRAMFPESELDKKVNEALDIFVKRMKK
jgi:5-methylcytosine-specific restriction protein B